MIICQHCRLRHIQLLPPFINHCYRHISAVPDSFFSLPMMWRMKNFYLQTQQVPLRHFPRLWSILPSTRCSSFRWFFSSSSKIFMGAEGKDGDQCKQELYCPRIVPPAVKPLEPPPSKSQSKERYKKHLQKEMQPLAESVLKLDSTRANCTRHLHVKLRQSQSGVRFIDMANLETASDTNKIVSANNFLPIVVPNDAYPMVQAMDKLLQSFLKNYRHLKFAKSKVYISLDAFYSPILKYNVKYELYWWKNKFLFRVSYEKPHRISYMDFSYDSFLWLRNEIAKILAEHGGTQQSDAHTKNCDEE